jgi:hypothetical protein
MFLKTVKISDGVLVISPKKIVDNKHDYGMSEWISTWPFASREFITN